MYKMLFVTLDTQPTSGVTISSPHANKRLILLSIKCHI